MITDVNFIRAGSLFPPSSELERMKRYEDHEEIWEGEHCEVFKAQMRRVERIIGQYDDIVAFPVLLNYQKLLSTKIADMLLSEAPKLEIESAPDVAEDLVTNTEFWNVVYEATIDTTRYGDGLLYLYKRDGETVLSVTQPKFWYPVSMPDDAKAIQAHVLAWIEGEDDNTVVVQYIHYEGRYEKRTYRVNAEGYSKNGQVMVGDRISSETFDTGLSGFAVVPLSNLTTTGCVFGRDDYRDINSVVAEAMVRVTQISKILDMHANPSMTGHDSLVRQDPNTGGYYFKTANFYPSTDGVKTEYITWDGKLEAAFKELDILMSQLYILSEMSKTLLDSEEAGVMSGTALQFKLLSPLYKAARLAKKFTPALRYVVQELTGIDKKKIHIQFKDGLPNDAKEIAEIVNSRVRERTMSVKRALMLYDEMTDEQAEDELAQIEAEQAAANPFTMPMDSNPMDPKNNQNGGAVDGSADDATGASAV